MNCKECGNHCVRKGIRNGVQQYRCNTCGKYQRSGSRRKQLNESELLLLSKLNNEGVGIRGIARILQMAASSVLRYLKILDSKIKVPLLKEIQQEYEVDEIQTFVGKNIPEHRVYVMYAINRHTREVVYYLVGSRTKANLQVLISKLMLLFPKRIYTDGLSIYRRLIPKSLHKVRRYAINRIERKNLSLRTHLKRLQRRTICFSRSKMMLAACLKIYFWG